MANHSAIGWVRGFREYAQGVAEVVQNGISTAQRVESLAHKADIAGDVSARGFDPINARGKCGRLPLGMGQR
jgi:hypothetical protein